MPIGERWLVLSVLAAAGRPALALAVLLVLGLLSLAYTSAGRSLRTRAWPRRAPTAREREIVAAQADPGPLPLRLGGLLAAGTGRWLWARPAVLRLAEYAALAGVVVAADAGALPPAYALLLVVASHHYDELYRVLHRLAPASRISRGRRARGRRARPAVVAVLALVSGGALAGGLWVLAAALGILYLVVEPVRVLHEVRSARPDAGEPGGSADG